MTEVINVFTEILRLCADKMIKAIIFDLYETLITMYNSELYTGRQISKDLELSEDDFYKFWHTFEYERTTGKITLEEILERIMKENGSCAEDKFNAVIKKRYAVQKGLYTRLHQNIIPMFETLRQNQILTGLISNCFSDERTIFRESILFPYIEVPVLSFDAGCCKPERKIFEMMMEMLNQNRSEKINPAECLYVGDGGSCELEAAKDFGMNALQACWYFKDGMYQPSTRKPGFIHLEDPLEVMKYLEI